LTKAGTPCRAWAIKGSEPPLCASHARLAREGAPGGNQESRRPAFYSPTLSEGELADLVAYADDMTLDDEIACTRVLVRRLMAIIEADGDLSASEQARLAGLALQGTRTVARLLRDKRALSGDAAEGLAGAIGQALDELSVEWGVEL
jgi:hypothetical protein